MPAPPTRITLEVELDGDRIEGHVVSGDGTRQPFSGWLGLASALEAVIAKPVAT